MKKRVLYGTNKLVDEITSSMQKIDVLDGGWTIKYKDSNTGDLWIKYVIDPDRGYFFNLMRIDPAPTTDELIEIAITSEFIDEVSAAASRLHLDEETSNNEFREKLINRLKQFDFNVLSDLDKKRIETIIISGELTNRINTRAIIGKKFNDIDSDYQFLCRIADEAELVMKKIND